MKGGSSRKHNVKYVNFDTRGRVVVALTEAGRLLPKDPEFADAVNEYITFLEKNVRSGGHLAREPISATEKKEILAQREIFRLRARKLEKKLKKRKPTQDSCSSLLDQNAATGLKRKGSKTNNAKGAKKRKFVEEEEKEVKLENEVKVENEVKEE